MMLEQPFIGSSVVRSIGSRPVLCVTVFLILPTHRATTIGWTNHSPTLIHCSLEEVFQAQLMVRHSSVPSIGRMERAGVHMKQKIPCLLTEQLCMHKLRVQHTRASQVSRLWTT